MTLISTAAEHLQAGNLLAAQQCYLQILQSPSTEHGRAFYGLGYIQQLQQNWPQAIEQFQQACQLMPGQASPLLGLANAFNHVFSEVDALTVLEFAQTKCPPQDALSYALTQQYIIMGKLDSAQQLLKTLLLSPNDEVFAFACLDASKLDLALLDLPCANDGNHTHLDRCQTIVSNKTASASAETRIYYTLGAVAKAQQDYDKAMSHWHAANALQLTNCNFHVEQMAGFFEQIKAIPADFFKQTISGISAISVGNNMHPTAQKQDSTAPFTPIFILGLPRTGSTLLEQQLCRLSSADMVIASVGEVDYIARECVDYLVQQTQHPFPTCLEMINPQQCAHARALYMNAIAAHRLQADYIIDKLPANFQSIPLIFKLFPEAKVIHLQRNLSATAFSIYSNDFALSEPYFSDLLQMRRYFTYYQETMAFYEHHYADKIHTLSYENLVSTPDKVLTHLLEYLDIAANKSMTGAHSSNSSDSDTCISAEKIPLETSVIKTLSAVQARKAIYTHAKALPSGLAKYFTAFE